MKKIKKFHIKTRSKNSGKLSVLNFDNKFPFKVKRIFFLYGKKNKIRGNHAHKKCSQFFVPLSGEIILYIKTLNDRKKIVLNHSRKTSILVPPRYWCTVKFTNKNSILMVVCDHYYDPKDYIKDFKTYKKYLLKK